MRRGENPRSWLELTAYRGRIWKHVFSPDGLWLATATGPTAYEELLTAYYPESTVRLWDLHRLKSWDLIGHDDVACDVAMTSDGNGVISASLDRTIRVWDFSALRRFQQQRIEAAATGDTSWSAGVPGGDIDAHESYAAQQAFRQHKTLLGGEMAVFHCVPSPDGSWLATVPMGKSASARLWRMNHGDGAAPIHVPKFVVPSQLAEISPAQKWFFFAAAGQASGGAAEFSANREWLLLWAEQHLLVFDVLHDRAEPHWTLDAQFESAHLSPDARWVAIRSQSKVVLADVNDSSRYRNVVSDIGPIQKVQCSPCGRWLITVEGESVCIRDLRRDDLTGAAAVIPTTGGEVPNIAIDPDGRLLLAGNRASATIWQLDEAGRASVFMELSGHGAEPGGVDGRFLARGRWLVTRDVARLQVWDLATRQRRLEVVEGSLKVGFAVDLTSDDRWLVVSQYGRVRLFDMHDPGAAPVTVREFAGGQIRFAISPDSRWLVTADSPIGTPLGRAGGLSVRVHDLWAPNVAESAVDLPGLDREPQRVQISWDSRWLATTGTELLLWPLGVPHLLDLAIETAGRDFTEEERRRYQID